jgi:4-carboxymuconolactone decarboxylase
MTRPPQRLAPPDPSTYSPRQQEIADMIKSGPRGVVRGPLAVWLHRPELAAKAQDLGRYCRYETTLGPKLSELAILVTARIYRSEYEWQAHKTHALNAGLEPEIVEAIRLNRIPDFTDPEESVVHDVARGAHAERRIDDGLYGRALAVLGEQRLVDLVGLLGYYTMISLTINIFQVPPLSDDRAGLSDE